jgi:hypothetical protein
MHKLLVGLLFSCITTLAFGQFSVGVGAGYLFSLDNGNQNLAALTIYPAYQLSDRLKLGVSISYLTPKSNYLFENDPLVIMNGKQVNTLERRSNSYLVPIELRAEYSLNSGILRPALGLNIGYWQRISKSVTDVEYTDGTSSSFSGTDNDGLISAGLQVGLQYDLSKTLSASFFAGYHLVGITQEVSNEYLQTRLELTYRFNKRAVAK